MGQVFPFICNILVKSPFHVFVSAIFDLKAPKDTIKPMDMKVNVRLDKEVVAWASRKVNKLTGLNAEQGWRIHAQQAVFNTFLLGPGPFRCLN